MIYIQTHSTDPAWNLAAEEYAQKQLTRFPEILMLWQNDNSIIVGRYQNMAKEINVKAARDLNVRVVRRSTGGGTVYHDLGNLNFSLISCCADPAGLDKARLSEPIVRALQNIGIDAVLSGRNDILLDGRKISGTAQSLSKGRLLHHGTLLFDSDLNVLAGVLHPDKKKLMSKSISSVRSRVTNIKTALDLDYDVGEFQEKLRREFEPCEEYEFTPEDRESIEELRRTKYDAWDWNTGKEPAFEYRNEKRYPGGLLGRELNFEKGIISHNRITGDFLGVSDIAVPEELLCGQKLDREEIARILGTIDLKLYLGEIGAAELIDCMFD